jgi:hypothetical protein
MNLPIVIVFVVIGTDDLGGGVIAASSKLKVEVCMNGCGLAHYTGWFDLIE